MAECELHGGGRERRRGADFLIGPLRALGLDIGGRGTLLSAERGVWKCLRSG